MANPAAEVGDVADGLWIWRVQHPAWQEGLDWEPMVTSTVVESGGEVVLVDPLAPPRDAPEICRTASLFTTARPSKKPLKSRLGPVGVSSVRRSVILPTDAEGDHDACGDAGGLAGDRRNCIRGEAAAQAQEAKAG